MRLLFILLLLGCFGLWAAPNAFDVNPRPPAAIPKAQLFTTKLECRPGSPFCPGPLRGRLFLLNGKFYAMGGRRLDLAGSDFTHPFEYDPDTNAWTTKTATYPDNQVNNMACAS